jgi:TadE-like protein
MKCPDTLRRFWHQTAGTATIEFVIVVPVVLTLFMAGLESGLLMTRMVLLDRAVDATMRELRLGHVTAPSHDVLKTEICSRAAPLVGCEGALLLELRRISRESWTLPTTQSTCIDRAATVAPVMQVEIGQQNDLMLVRACIVIDALFPTTGLALGLPQDSLGGYGLVAVSAYVNEPV